MKVKSLISNQVLEEHVKVESIDKDINAIIDKYAGDLKNVSSYGDVEDNKSGFFLLWIKKDLNAPKDEQLRTTTFAQSISMDDVEVAIHNAMSNIQEEQKKPINIA